MGQYYSAAILGDNKKTVKQHVYSWNFNSGLKLMEHSWMENPFVKSFETLIHNNPQRVVWAGDYADNCPGNKTNVYQRCTDKNKVKPEYELSLLDSLYVINHSTKQYIDKTKVPSRDGWRIHPLPLMTCEGNGRGGGDYRGDEDYVGSWARDIISVSNVVPEGYSEFMFNLVEQ